MHSQRSGLQTKFHGKGCSFSRFRLSLLMSWVMALCFVSTAYAESIGRTNLSLDSDKWTLLTKYEGQLVFDQGLTTGKLYIEVFQIPGPNGDPMALLMVTSTDISPHTHTKWMSETCPESRDQFYAEDFGSNRQRWVRDCLMVDSEFSALKFFSPKSKVRQALDEKGLHLFTSGYAVRSVFGATNGVLLRATLLTTKNFKGLANTKIDAEQLHGVPSELIAWGEEVRRRIKDSAQSMSGKLKIPPVEFSD